MQTPKIICGLGLLALSLASFADNHTQSVSLPVVETSRFVEVIDKIRNNYFEDVNDSVLFENAIIGMLSRLDPHSAYLNEEASDELKVRTQGKFGGLGIQVDMHESGLVRVVSPIDDTPAYRAGLQSGDLITKLDDRAVKGMTLNDAVDIMRGDPGDPITLTVLREGEPQPLVFSIVRDIIKVASVKSDYLGNQIAYLRITNFQENTARELISAYDKLTEQRGRLAGIVLDLRNNPGGLLPAAIQVSDMFISEGLLVYTEGRTRQSRTQAVASSRDYTDGVPVVVLINGGTASASEIVAGALQDHNRGVVLGTRSFGKGSVQSVLELNGGKAAIKITTALYFTPSGRSIQAEGIEPDIEVKLARVEDLEENRVSERSLSGHLENANKAEPDDGEEESLQLEERNRISARLANDFQLKEAVNMLRGIAILSERSPLTLGN